MTLNEETFSIEFNVGDNDPIKYFTLHVRGGQESLKSIKIFCEKFGCKALDTTENKIIDFNEESSNGLYKWKEYRDKIIHMKQN